MRRVGHGLLLAALWSSGTLPTDASTVERLQFAEVAKQADLIIKASVRGGSTRNEIRNGMPWMCRTFDVATSYKGEAGREIEFCFMGGQTGGATTAIVGLKIPEEGKSGFFFAYYPWKNYPNPLVGWSQGVFYIAPHPASSDAQILTSMNGFPVWRIEIAGGSERGDGIPDAAAGVLVADSPSSFLSPEQFPQVVHEALIAP